MPDYTRVPPCGFDRADGIDSRPGTPDPANALLANPQIYNLAGLYLQEDPGSPEIERGDQATFRHTFTVDYQTGLALSSAMPRGGYITDSRGYIYKILSTNLNSRRAHLATFVITSESVSFDNPPDEFHVQTIELNPAIEKHPMFWDIVGNGLDVNPYNLDNVGAIITPGLMTGPNIVASCKLAADAIDVAANNDLIANINATTVGNTAVANLATLKLYPRYLRKEETFYLAGFRVVWSSYFYLPPLMDGGGYIQDPVTQGGLPPYFWSTTMAVGGDNILLKKAKLTNPQIYQRGLSWLRLADELEYQRTWFHLTRSWLGGPLGQWDKAIYPTYP
jgi:hypothetical protein